MLKNDRLLRNTSIVLALIGVIDSLYLLYIKFSLGTAVCSGGCDIVNTSKYSEIFGIPIAIIGALGYLAIMFFLFLDKKVKLIEEYSVIAVFGFSFVGFLYSIYLTYLELAVIHAICEYCVISAIVITLIFIISIIRLNTAE